MKRPSRSHYNAICGDWVAKHNRTTHSGVGNCSSKTGSRRQSEKKTILKHFLKGFLEGKSLAPKWRKSADKSLPQPSCRHSNTIYEVQLQKTIVLRMHPKEEATLAIPFTVRERSYSCKAQWNSICNSSTSTTCNPIYSEGTILQLQITMEFHRQHVHMYHLQPHLQCGNDPTVANHNGILSTTHARKTVETPFTMRNRSETDPRISEDDPTTHETVPQPSHRRGRSSTFGDGLCMEKHRVSCICYLSKTHFVRDFLQNSIGNSSTSTTCNPICTVGTILQLQSTMEFHLQLLHQHHLQSHLQWGNDPRVANHNGIPSATHPPAPLATPFTMREQSYSCKSQWNSVDHTCTKNSWNPIYNAEPIRDRSENIRGWSDHTRDRLATVAPQR